MLLVTGGAGSVATMLRPHLRAAGLALRLFDLRMPADTGPDDVVLGDLADAEALTAAIKGCDAVLHLAGCVSDAPWTELVAGSVTGSIAVFEAARAAGVSRVVYASSNHAVGMHPRSRRLDAGATLRPDSRYGVGKAFGELLGAFFADKYDMRVLCIRIGSASEAPIDRRRLSIWISPRDLAQLVLIGLRSPALRFAVVYGVSDNARSFYDNRVAELLGYQAKDRAEEYAPAILLADPYPAADEPPAPGEFAQGGDFAQAEFIGDPTRLRQW